MATLIYQNFTFYDHVDYVYEKARHHLFYRESLDVLYMTALGLNSCVEVLCVERERIIFSYVTV